jgi:hypothetical protein
MATRVRATWHGPRVTAAIRAAAVDGLGQAADHLLHTAQGLAPVLTSELERTGTASVDPAGLQAAASFDGDHAVIQHEALDFEHPHGGQAKYLEQPMHTERDVMLGLIAEPVRRALRE